MWVIPRGRNLCGSSVDHVLPYLVSAIASHAWHPLDSFTVSPNLPTIGSMPKPKRQCIRPSETWEQLELLFTSPEQRIYAAFPRDRHDLLRPLWAQGEPQNGQTYLGGNTATCASHATLPTSYGEDALTQHNGRPLWSPILYSLTIFTIA